MFGETGQRPFRSGDAPERFHQRGDLVRILLVTSRPRERDGQLLGLFTGKELHAGVSVGRIG